MKDIKIGETTKNTFGTSMMIISYKSSSDIDVEFLDDFHYVKEHATYLNFKRGQIKNPYDPSVISRGYLGDGDYQGDINGKKTPAYFTWTDIINRCYNENKQLLFPAYFNKSVICNKWLNFQNYASWFEDHYYEVNERLHIDKDMKYPGNKIYSPYHCMLLPQSINNMLINKPNKRGLPNGISFSNNFYHVKYSGLDFGKYETLEEAFAVKARVKEKSIQDKAISMRDILPNDVFEIIMNYKVLIENDKNYVEIAS